MATVAKRFGGKVKAAGGVRSYSDAVKMIEAGAYPFLSSPYLICFLMVRIDLEQVVVLLLCKVCIFVNKQTNRKLY